MSRPSACGIFSMGLLVPAKNLPVVMLEQDLPKFMSGTTSRPWSLIPTGSEDQAPILTARAEGKVSERSLPRHGPDRGPELRQVRTAADPDPAPCRGAWRSHADGVPEHGISDRVLPKYTDIENVRRWPGPWSRARK